MMPGVQVVQRIAALQTVYIVTCDGIRIIIVLISAVLLLVCV